MVTQLLDKWMQEAKQYRVAAIHVGANAKNARAMRFLQKQGFGKLNSPASRTAWMDHPCIIFLMHLIES
jgi:hypothetical protein